jgi:hypothetical protein
MSLLDTFKKGPISTFKEILGMFGKSNKSNSGAYDETPQTGNGIDKVWDSDQQAWKYVRATPSATETPMAPNPQTSFSSEQRTMGDPMQDQQVLGSQTNKVTPPPRLEGGKYGEFIHKYFGDESRNALRTLQGENALQKPNAVNVNNDGSRDVGVFQINSNTFKDFMKRKGNLLKSYGISSFDDMFDPEKNIIMAKIIHGEQGWKAWYGAPPDLRM